MNKNFMVSFLLLFSVFSTHSALADKKVDCDKSKNDQGDLQKAVNNANSGAVIPVSGNCEDVALVISRSQVTLQGPATFNGNGVDDVIRVEDSGDVTLNDLVLTGGQNGLTVAAARATATTVDASNNATEGFSVIQSGSLVCRDCTASGNGARGLLVIGSTTLCGSNQFNGNITDGILVFLGGKVFGSTPVCGDPGSIEANGNGATGVSLFQNASWFTDGTAINANQNAGSGLAIQESSAFSTDQAAFHADDNLAIGAFINSGSTVRLNALTGSTSLQGNLVGVIAQQNSQLTANGVTIFGSVAPVDVIVQDFGVANANGTFGPVSCEAGQSSGSLCP